MIRRLALLALFCIFAQTLTAQTIAGRIVGTILDGSNAAIPRARVVATNTETGIRRQAESGGEGQYVLYPLGPGTYELEAQASGFKTGRLSGIRLDVASTVTCNLVLELGPVDQQITVSAEAAPILTQSFSVESTIVREQIDSLPLNGRDFNQLVLLAAGAVENINSGNNKDFGAAALNGNRAFSNDYLLDGTPNNDLYQGRSGVPASVDVIREFKVTSGVAPAEFGQAGTQVSVVTRSGTNRFHGSLFEYHRGNTWEARNPFNTGAEQPFLRNQFGGSLGGPARLPGYDGRNRTFFFLNYEGNRQSENVTRVATVPPDEFWRGDFSSLLARNIQLRDPFLAGRPAIPGNRLDLYLGAPASSPPHRSCGHSGARRIVPARPTTWCSFPRIRTTPTNTPSAWTICYRATIPSRCGSPTPIRRDSRRAFWATAAGSTCRLKIAMPAAPGPRPSARAP